MHNPGLEPMLKRSPSAVSFLVLLGLVTLCCALPSSAQSRAEIILLNGKIITGDATFSYQEALAITDGRIVALGSVEDIEKLAGPNTLRIDLGGKTVIPGLADNHLHSLGGGPGVDLSRTRTLEELLEAISVRVKQSDSGELVITNSNWHEAQSLTCSGRACPSLASRPAREASSSEERQSSVLRCGCRLTNSDGRSVEHASRTADSHSAQELTFM